MKRTMDWVYKMDFNPDWPVTKGSQTLDHPFETPVITLPYKTIKNNSTIAIVLHQCSADLLRTTEKKKWNTEILAASKGGFPAFNMNVSLTLGKQY